MEREPRSNSNSSGDCSNSSGYLKKRKTSTNGNKKIPSPDKRMKYQEKDPFSIMLRPSNTPYFESRKTVYQLPQGFFSESKLIAAGSTKDGSIHYLMSTPTKPLVMGKINKECDFLEQTFHLNSSVNSIKASFDPNKGCFLTMLNEVLLQVISVHGMKLAHWKVYDVVYNLPRLQMKENFLICQVSNEEVRIIEVFYNNSKLALRKYSIYSKLPIRSCELDVLSRKIHLVSQGGQFSSTQLSRCVEVTPKQEEQSLYTQTLRFEVQCEHFGKERIEGQLTVISSSQKSENSFIDSYLQRGQIALLSRGQRYYGQIIADSSRERKALGGKDDIIIINENNEKIWSVKCLEQKGWMLLGMQGLGRVIQNGILIHNGSAIVFQENEIIKYTL